MGILFRVESVALSEDIPKVSGGEEEGFKQASTWEIYSLSYFYSVVSPYHVDNFTFLMINYFGLAKYSDAGL